MEFSEVLLVARLAVTVTAAVAAVVLGVSGGLIALIIRQSRILGAIEVRLEAADKLFERLLARTAWFDLALSDVRQQVETRCADAPAPADKGNGGEVVRHGGLSG